MKLNYWKLAILLFIFLTTIQLAGDLDLGWHLRYGEYFFKTGHVLKANILSYFWPDYQWVQGSWGYDLLVYQIFTHFGFLGISIIGALFSLIIFLIITYPLSRFSFFQLLFLAVIFITQSISLFAVGMRSQTPSTLLFAITFVLADKTLKKSKPAKSLYLLPLLFWIWANLHGGFSLGLITLSIIWIGHGILKGTSKTVWKILGINLLLSIFTPFINPWGGRIYEETIRHASNPNLLHIIEWMPLLNWRSSELWFN